jgi:hypothetical protein
VAQLDKAMTVAKLKAVRDRKKARTGKCEGRKSHAEAGPEAVALARRLACKRPNGGKLSLRAIAAALAAEGHFNERGQPFHPMSVASMLAS